MGTSRVCLQLSLAKRKSFLSSPFLPLLPQNLGTRKERPKTFREGGYSIPVCFGFLGGGEGGKEGEILLMIAKEEKESSGPPFYGEGGGGKCCQFKSNQLFIF